MIICIAVLITLFFRYWVVVTRAGHITIMNIWGGEIDGALEPGWIIRPFPPSYRIEAVVFIDKRTVDIGDFAMVCLHDRTSMGWLNITAKEVSLAYELDFRGKNGQMSLTKLKNYTKLTDSTHTISNARIKEFLKDKIQSALRTEAAQCTMDELHATTGDIADKVKAALTSYVEHEDVMLPIKIISLLINQPVVITDEAPAKAFADKATFAAERAAAKEKMGKERYIAEQKVIIAETEGQAVVKRLDAIYTAYGIDALPREKRFEALQAVELVQAQVELARNPASKVVIGASLSNEHRALLAPLSALALLGTNNPNKPDGNQGA
jgi:hypothetical protein